MKSFSERTSLNDTNLYEFERIYRLVSSLYGNKEKTVLDFGCGSGYGSFILSKKFKKIFAIDIDNEIIKYCKNRYSSINNLEFKNISLNLQPFENKHFDFIFSFQVIEHIPIKFVNSFIENIWQILKKEGIAVITTPNANNYHKKFSGNPFHEKEYTKDELQILLKNVIPNNRFNIFAIKDILSTRLSLLLRRKFKETVISRLLAKILKISLQFFEKNIFLPSNYQKIIVKINPENIIGSFYIEIKK